MTPDDRELAEKLRAYYNANTGPIGTDHPVFWDGMAQIARALIGAELAAKAVPDGDEVASAKDEAVNFVFSELAKMVNLSGFEIHDGSETWGGDVSATLYGILRQAGIIDDDDNFTVATLTAQAEALRAENERLREVLKFYGNANFYKSATVYMCGHSGDSSVQLEGGKRARAALAQSGGE